MGYYRLWVITVWVISGLTVQINVLMARITHKADLHYKMQPELQINAGLH
jgi:hypothetical protein